MKDQGEAGFVTASKRPARARLSLAHRQRYYALAGYMYQADPQTPHQAREIAWRELPKEQTDSVKRQRGVGLTDLANALAQTGQFAEARKAYEESLTEMQTLRDDRSVGAVLGQLGMLAMQEG